MRLSAASITSMINICRIWDGAISTRKPSFLTSQLREISRRRPLVPMWAKIWRMKKQSSIIWTWELVSSTIPAKTPQKRQISCTKTSRKTGISTLNSRIRRTRGQSRSQVLWMTRCLNYSATSFLKSKCVCRRELRSKTRYKITGWQNSKTTCKRENITVNASKCDIQWWVAATHTLRMRIEDFQSTTEIRSNWICKENKNRVNRKRAPPKVVLVVVTTKRNRQKLSMVTIKMWLWI